VSTEEVAGQQAVSLSAQERPPGRVRVPRRRSAPSGAQDPAHCRFADVVTEPGQLAVYPAVTPGRVVLGQLQYQVADGLIDPRAAWPVRIRPLACDQAAVPGQQRARRDEPMGAQHGGQQPGERCQDRPIGPVRLRPGDLTPQHRDLMTEHHDLRILGRLAAAKQHEPAEDPDCDHVEQTKTHEPRSWRKLRLRPNCRSQRLRRVLKRYRTGSLTPTPRQVTLSIRVLWPGCLLRYFLAAGATGATAVPRPGFTNLAPAGPDVR
jgi:hypothetical protein